MSITFVKKWQGMIIVLFMAIFLITGCSSDSSGGSDDDTTAPDDGGTTPVSNLASIDINAEKTTISPLESLKITVSALSKSGQGLSGETISLSLDNPALGSITSSVTTGNDGKATATFTANARTGTISIKGESGEVSSSGLSVNISSISSPANMALTVSPTSLVPGETSSIQAEVTTESGDKVADGTEVTFEVSNPLVGTITSSANTSSGIAKATFTASSAGNVTVTVQSDSVKRTVDLNVTKPADVVKSLSIFPSQDSVEPDGQIDITITAYNESGKELRGVDITLSLDEPSKGFIEGSITTGSNGSATTIFNARSLSGDINITASSGSIEDTRKITILNQNAPADITLEASPSPILSGKTSTITATVKDAKGNAVPNGTIISFSLDNETYGSITEQAATNAGKASVTFSSADVVGTAKIIAKSGAESESLDLKIDPVQASSIEFLEVSQNPVAIKGSGGVEFSVIKFGVKDINGNPAQDINVRFTMAGPGGIGYIEDEDSTPYVADVSTVNGVATATFHSGYEAGTVTITAELDRNNDGTYDIYAKTPVISIGGGTPSDNWFSISSDKWNLPGLNADGVEANITVRLADRFGNYNILNGHSVSFRASKGIAVDTSAVSVDTKGVASVILRTQAGSPFPVPGIDDWEKNLRADIKADYGTGTTFDNTYPRLGWATLMVYTKGEEYFQDGSKIAGYVGKTYVNGQYDEGEIITDTIHEPFMDYNHDGSWTQLDSEDPFEDYVDVNNNDIHEGINGEWDSDKYLFRNDVVVTSGEPKIFFKTTDNNYNIPDKGSRTFVVLVCDKNMNRISDGSNISFSVDGGTIKSVSSTDTSALDAYAENDKDQYALITYSVTVGDPDPKKFETAPSALTCTVSWFDGISTTTISSEPLIGTVN